MENEGVASLPSFSSDDFASRLLLLGKEGVGKCGRQRIASFVIGVTVMSSHPDESHFVQVDKVKENLPQVGIFHLVFLPDAEVFRAPGLCPAEIERIDKVFGIGIEGHPTRLFQGA